MFKIAGGILLAAIIWNWGATIALVLLLAGLYVAVAMPHTLLMLGLLIAMWALSRMFQARHRP